MDGPGDAANYCREGIEFAEYVGFDFEKVPARTTVDTLLCDLLLKEALTWETVDLKAKLEEA